MFKPGNLLHTKRGSSAHRTMAPVLQYRTAEKLARIQADRTTRVLAQIADYELRCINRPRSCGLSGQILTLRLDHLSNPGHSRHWSAGHACGDNRLSLAEAKVLLKGQSTLFHRGFPVKVLHRQLPAKANARRQRFGRIYSPNLFRGGTLCKYLHFRPAVCPDTARTSQSRHTPHRHR